MEKRRMNHKLKVDTLTIILILLLAKNINYQSDDRRLVVDCVEQVLQQNFDHVDNLEPLEIYILDAIS